MANQITHIILAERLSDLLFENFDAKAFLVGTVFPDIRYLEVIDREKTHFSGLTFPDILNESDSFLAGMKYHSLVDEAREAFVVEKGMYDLMPSSKYITQAMKIYEDEVLYSSVSDWDQVNTYLDLILPEETSLVDDTDGIKKWHVSMQAYFKEPPTDVSRQNFILALGFSKEVAAEINGLIDQMRQDPKIRETIVGMHENWRALVGVI